MRVAFNDVHCYVIKRNSLFFTSELPNDLLEGHDSMETTKTEEKHKRKQNRSITIK